MALGPNCAPEPTTGSERRMSGIAPSLYVNVRAPPARAAMPRVCNSKRGRYTLQLTDFSGDGFVTRDEICQLLAEHGVQATPQRVLVAEVVFAKPQHLSADQIIAGIRASGARVSKATVYNTLNLFRERGLLRTVDVDPERQFYDSTNHPHHHFFNVDTGELIDIPLDAVQLNLSAGLPPGTHQEGVDVVIRVRQSSRE